MLKSQAKKVIIVITLCSIGLFMFNIGERQNGIENELKHKGKRETNSSTTNLTQLWDENIELRCSNTSLENNSRSKLQEVFDFEEFDNEKGTDQLIVPNIVHLIYLNVISINFNQLMCIYSIFLNQNPDKIMIHCDNCEFGGRYWEQLMATRCLREKIVLHKIPSYYTIFGVQVNWITHRLISF